MAQRSRKRGRRGKAKAGRPERAAGPREARPESRSSAGPERARRAAAAAPATAPARSGRASRSEERNAAVRAALEPLAPGERPWAVRIGALIALLVGAGDLVDVLAGGHVRFGSSHSGTGGVILFSIVMLVCAVGMWKMRYWAVLGFQAILGIVILIFSLLLIRASNLLGVVLSVVVVFGGGYLFFKLVRALSRIQMPKYPGR